MMSQDESFQYGAKSLDAIELSISPERFRTYLGMANGDRKAALHLYERNTYLSEALYGVIQPTEIALRNAVHRAISQGPHGTLWFEKVGLLDPQSDMVTQAIDDLRRNNRQLTPGAIVAELRLGFWTALMSSRYEKLLWVPYLHRCFPHAKVKRADGKLVVADRKSIHGELDKVRELRNRIAHHETILKRPLNEQYDRVLMVLGWICPTTASWTKYTNCFEERFRLQVNLTARTQSFPLPAKQPTPGLPREKVFKTGG